MKLFESDKGGVRLKTFPVKCVPLSKHYSPCIGSFSSLRVQPHGARAPMGAPAADAASASRNPSVDPSPGSVSVRRLRSESVKSLKSKKIVHRGKMIEI